MKRLVNVADEVDDELSRLVPPPGVQAFVEELLRVVLDGADNTAILFTVTFKIHAAVRGRGVLGIYEVKVTGETAPFATFVCFPLMPARAVRVAMGRGGGSRVANRVGPGGDAGQVMFGIIPEEVFEVGGRLLLHEVASDIGDGDMPQA